MTKKRVEATSAIIAANILNVSVGAVIWHRWGYFEAGLAVIILTALMTPACGILNVLTMGDEK